MVDPIVATLAGLGITGAGWVTNRVIKHDEAIGTLKDDIGILKNHLVEIKQDIKTLLHESARANR